MTAASQEPMQGERFCAQCGSSFVPLDVPHSSKECGTCGRTIHFVRYAPGGGIRIEAGEQFTIPAGWLTMSLDPAASRGKLFRPGLRFLLRQLFLGGHPKQSDDIAAFFKQLDTESDKYLENCERFKGVDLSSEEEAKKAFETLSKDSDSRDCHVMAQGVFSHAAVGALGDGDANRAAWAGYMAGVMRGLTIVTEPMFEQTLWRGYLANQVVYEAASAASHSPAEAEALKALQPLFQRLDEATLHAWVESGLPIGPRIGVKELPEELIKALARFQLVTIQRERGEAERAERERREDTRQAKSDRRADSELRLKWIQFVWGILSGGLLSAAAYWVANYFGWT